MDERIEKEYMISNEEEIPSAKSISPYRPMEGKLKVAKNKK